MLNRFLAIRCDRAFLQSCLANFPNVFDRISSPGLRLGAVSEVSLALRLFEFGLLPEAYRTKFVQAVTDCAVEGEDGYIFENESLRKMLTPDENAKFVARLRNELIPNLREVRNNWEGNYDSDEDPESYIQPFEAFLNALESEFPEDSDLLEIIDRESLMVGSWVRDTLSASEERRHGPEEADDWEPDESPCRGSYAAERSIFDDVDL